MARDLELNRQQFARYLNGSTIPRQNIVRRMAQYFDVDEGDLFSARPIPTTVPRNGVAGIAALGRILEALDFTDPDEQILPSGFYMIYKVSFRYDGKIFAGLCRVSRDAQGAVVFKRRSSARYLSWPVGAVHSNVFHGLFLQKGGQLIMFDYGSQTSSFTIHAFLPRLHFDASTKPGLHMTFGELPLEAAKASRIVMRKIDDTTTSVLQAARAQGFLVGAAIPGDIAYLLETEISPEDPIFRIKL